MVQQYEQTPQEVALDVSGMRVPLSDGQKVGTTLRNLAFLDGHSEADVRKIHREHLACHIDDGVELEVLGSNPTRIDGAARSKGDRIAVSDGDRIDLSGVVEATVVIE